MSPETYISRLQACCIVKRLAEGKQVHAHILRNSSESSIFVWNTVVIMYVKCGSILDAWEVFYKMGRRNVFTWTTIIGAYAISGDRQNSIKLFHQMMETGTRPDKVSFVSVGACEMSEQGKWLHACTLANGCELNIFVGSALVDMYSKCGSIEDAGKVFERIPSKDVVTWNAMISCHSQRGNAHESDRLFNQMQEEGSIPNMVITLVSTLSACSDMAQGKRIHAHALKAHYPRYISDIFVGTSDVFLGNTLIVMYGKCGHIWDACLVFERMHAWNIVSWNAMVAACVVQGCHEEAIQFFRNMSKQYLKPDKITFTNVLGAYSNLEALEEGKILHAQTVTCGYVSDVVIQNALLDMYTKCGTMDDAQEIFDGMHMKNVISWTIMFAGYGNHGLYMAAISVFQQMHDSGIKPDDVTFVAALNSCSSIVKEEVA